MNEKAQKLEKLMHALKINVKDEKALEKDFDSILGMFDEIKNIEVKEVDAKLNKKKMKIEDLREDEAIEADFRPEMKGNYFKVLAVSKK